MPGVVPPVRSKGVNFSSDAFSLLIQPGKGKQTCTEVSALIVRSVRGLNGSLACLRPDRRRRILRGKLLDLRIGVVLLPHDLIGGEIDAQHLPEPADVALGQGAAARIMHHGVHAARAAAGACSWA